MPDPLQTTRETFQAVRETFQMTRETFQAVRETFQMTRETFQAVRETFQTTREIFQVMRETFSDDAGSRVDDAGTLADSVFVIKSAAIAAKCNASGVLLCLSTPVLIRFWVQMTETEFEQNLNGLDLRLFETIPSQSTEDDKRSLLAVQRAVRELAGNYSYLEIGSYLGGSIQPHLLDAKCKSIWSIDKRPPSQPDERGFEWKYNNNSTARMLEMLKGVAEDVSKIKTIDGDTRDIAANRVEDKIDLCFIDGEHTDEAAFADFKFCLTVLQENGAIMFHDSQIAYGGIADSLRYLTEKGISHRAYVLPNVLFVVEIGEFPLHRDEKIAAMLAENHKSYLYALNDNDRYRRFANRFPFGTLRRLMLKIRGGNVSE